MSSKAYPPAPKHLRAACAHPSGHLTSHGSRTTLQVYLDDGLVYRNDADGYRLPAGLTQAQGAGPYVITGAGRRSILNDSQLAAIDSADEDGALRDVSWPTAAALARLALVEYRDADGAPAAHRRRRRPHRPEAPALPHPRGPRSRTRREAPALTPSLLRRVQPFPAVPAPPPQVRS